MRQVYVPGQHITFIECPLVKALSKFIERLKNIIISLKWKCIQRTVTIPMPEYVNQDFHKFNHKLLTISEYAPHKHISPTYDLQVQYEEPVDTSYLLSPAEKT